MYVFILYVLCIHIMYRESQVSEFKVLFILLFSELRYNERRVTANVLCHHVNVMCVTMQKITIIISK